MLRNACRYFLAPISVFMILACTVETPSQARGPKNYSLAVTSLSPTSGPVGASVAIYGAGFSHVKSVAFNGTWASAFVVVSTGQINAIVPGGASTGVVSVQTTWGTASSPTLFSVTQSTSPPHISSFTPTNGPCGLSVTIAGTALTGASAVKFNGMAAAFHVISDTAIGATVPTGATTGPLSVTTPGGTATSSASFAVSEPASPPVVASFAPTSGTIGTTVTVAGSGFTGATSVAFNGVAGTFSVASDSSLTAVVPSGALTGSISVTTPAGTGSSTGNFTVLAGPHISSFSPTSGAVGTAVTIAGSGFTGATAVAFNSTGSTFQVISDSQISTTVPANATTGRITVRTAAGTATSSSSFTVTSSSGDSGGKSRGYVTTPGELATIAQKASQGIEPYHSAVLSAENFANTGSSSVQASNANPTFWPYGTISGSQSCGGTLSPSFLGNGAPLIEAKAITYGLLLPTNPTLADQYAADVRTELLELATTSGYGGTSYSGGNQCILNLAWYTPGWVIAADMIEGYSGWSASDKQTFQQWLATVVYRKVDWASDTRSNNWGAAGSYTSAVIADYLSGSGILMVDRNGATIDSHDAYAQAKQRQLDRMTGNSYMDNYNCGSPGQGFRPDGGIPEELARGSTGCSGLWIKSEDSSWMYTMTHLQGAIMHAELLLRRGDPSIYNYITSTGGGSLQHAYRFILANPNPGGLSWSWNIPNEISELEFLYRYYRDSLLANQLGVGTASRLIAGKSGQMLHFGTITHGFAVGENPGAPPTVPAP